MKKQNYFSWTKVVLACKIEMYLWRQMYKVRPGPLSEAWWTRTSSPTTLLRPHSSTWCRASEQYVLGDKFLGMEGSNLFLKLWHWSWVLYLQFPNCAMMDVARCVIVEFVLVKFSLCLMLVTGLLRPILNYAWTGLLYGYPRYNHCFTYVIPLRYVHLKPNTLIKKLKNINRVLLQRLEWKKRVHVRILCYN